MSLPSVVAISIQTLYSYGNPWNHTGFEEESLVNNNPNILVIGINVNVNQVGGCNLVEVGLPNIEPCLEG